MEYGGRLAERLALETARQPTQVDVREEETFISRGQTIHSHGIILHLFYNYETPRLELDEALDWDCSDALDGDAAAATVGEIRLRLERI